MRVPYGPMITVVRSRMRMPDKGPVEVGVRLTGGGSRLLRIVRIEAS
jgi:hypothetical protein